jgi:hypothetical protein
MNRKDELMSETADASALGPLLAVREYVTALVNDADAWYDARQAEEARLRAEGYRIVSGGGDHEQWSIIDYRTREVIAEGSGGPDEYDEATDRLTAEGPPLYHVDHLGPEDWPDVPVPAGVPAGLAAALSEWVLNCPEEAVEWADGDVKH